MSSEGVRPELDAEWWEDQLTSGEPFYRFESAWAQPLTAIEAAALALQRAGPDGKPLFTREALAKLWDLHRRVEFLEDRGPLGEGWQSDELAECTAALEKHLLLVSSLLPPEEP